jgi:type VI secretion system protein ImpH
MSTYGWGKTHAVADWLFAEGYRFDFYRAVALLERLQPHRVPLAEGSDPQREAVHFTSSVALSFPASDVADIRRPDPTGGPAVMQVRFLGLAGGLGPMPMPYTELLLERLWSRDTALRDFLDQFNHRLVSLFYRVRKLHRVGIDFTPPEQTPVAQYLFSLMGLGTSGLQARMHIKDRALLFYTGLLAQRPRSMIGLTTLLSDYFQVRVVGEPFRGQWYRLEADQVTRLGRTGQNHRLGQEVVLGRRIWRQADGFRLRLGPLSLAQFVDFLPSARGFRSLYEFVRFYVGPALEVELRLTLQAEAVPDARLSATQGPRLGWTSWLKTQPFTQDDTQVRLNPRRLQQSLTAIAPTRPGEEDSDEQ